MYNLQISSTNTFLKGIKWSEIVDRNALRPKSTDDNRNFIYRALDLSHGLVRTAPTRCSHAIARTRAARRKKNDNVSHAKRARRTLARWMLACSPYGGFLCRMRPSVHLLTIHKARSHSLSLSISPPSHTHHTSPPSVSVARVCASLPYSMLVFIYEYRIDVSVCAKCVRIYIRIKSSCAVTLPPRMVICLFVSILYNTTCVFVWIYSYSIHYIYFQWTSSCRSTHSCLVKLILV